MCFFFHWTFESKLKTVALIVDYACPKFWAGYTNLDITCLLISIVVYLNRNFDLTCCTGVRIVLQL